MQSTLSELKRQLAGETRARLAVENREAAALVRAEKAEASERNFRVALNTMTDRAERAEASLQSLIFQRGNS